MTATHHAESSAIDEAFQDVETMRAALQAIIARVNGEFDHPRLMAFGLLSSDIRTDVMALAHAALNKVSS